MHQIPTEGLHLEGSRGSEILDLHEQGIHPVSDVRFALDVGVSEGGLFATGRVEVDLDLECVSCLATFRYPLEVPNFACQIELSGAELVDLTEAVREDILLALPPHPHCDWNGERACHGLFPRSQTESAAAPFTETPDAWGALDQLKLKKNH